MIVGALSTALLCNELLETGEDHGVDYQALRRFLVVVAPAHFHHALTAMH